MTLVILSVTAALLAGTTAFLAFNQWLMVREIERIKKDVYYLQRAIESSQSGSNALTGPPW